MFPKTAMTLLALLALTVGAASAQAQFRPAIDPPTDFVPTGPSSFPPLTVPPPPPGWLGSPPVAAPTAPVGLRTAAGSIGKTATGANAFSFFEWTTGPEAEQITASMSPDLYDRFHATGLAATAGTVTTAPQVLGGSPGPGVLVLGGTRYKWVRTNGFAQAGNRKVFVVILTNEDLSGDWLMIWRSGFRSRWTLKALGPGRYSAQEHDGGRVTGIAQLTGNVLRIPYNMPQVQGVYALTLAADRRTGEGHVDVSRGNVGHYQFRIERLKRP